MGIELGRISGPLLASNLVRKNSGAGEENLAFETDLLYLDVINGRVGINTDTPSRVLTVNGNVRIDDLTVTTQFETPNFAISTNRIQNLIGRIYLQPDQTTNPTILAVKLGTLNLRISDLLIENITDNSDINFAAIGSGKTIITSPRVNVSKNLHATGDITWSGDVTFGSGDDDNIEFKSDINSNIIPNIDVAYDLGTSAKRWNTVYGSSLTADNATTPGFTAGTLTANDTARFDGNAYLGSDSADTVNFNSTVDSDLTPSISNTYTLGTTTGPKRWNTLYVDRLDIDGVIEIENNTVTTLTADTNLELSANGLGKIVVASSDVNIANNVTVVDDLTVNGITTVNGIEIGSNSNPATVTVTGSINQTGDTYITGTFANNNINVSNPSYVSVPNIKLENNQIIATAPASNLIFSANGTGGVIFDRQLKINNATITNIFDGNSIELSFNNLYITEDSNLLITESGDNYLVDAKSDRDLSIIFEPTGTGNVIISSNKAITVAYGNNLTRVLESVGEIRQNSTTGLYEGFVPTSTISFNNVYSANRTTYITPELTPGANDNIIRFSVAGIIKSTISATAMYSQNLLVDNVSISRNTITNSNSAADLEFSTAGSGSVIVNNISFRNNSITGSMDNALVLSSTGTGYVKFGGTGGAAFPAGNDATRAATPELGQFRYSTERNYSEVYNGTNWVPASGADAAATEEEIQTETNLWSFILG